MKFRLIKTALVSAVCSVSFLPTAPLSLANAADNDGYIFHDTFEQSTDSWAGRGAATVSSTGNEAYAGSKSVSVAGRTASWNGVYKEINAADFVPGNEYSFSVNAMYNGYSKTEEFKLTLQYKGADGETHYPNIAAATVSAGQWIQLANTNYEIPPDATDMLIYVETSDSTTDFFIDEAIAAPAGTKIEGAKPLIVSSGDVNCDGTITSLDLSLMRNGLINGFSNKFFEKSADIDENGTVEVADMVQLNSFLLGRIGEFTKVEKPKNTKWDEYQETASPQYIQFYKDAICNMGNTSRLQAKLSAAEEGAPLKVAYLGGSITEGKKYTDPLSNYIKSAFAPNSSFVNAGLSGTSSVVGLVRSEKDIYSSNPDIVFLEFSVNDHEDIMYKKCFESLVRKTLEQPNEPAVIIIINRSKGGFSSQEQMEKIGKNYNVPVISMNNALTKAFNSGLLTTADYYTDEYHPHDNGGKLISDCIGYYLRQAMKTENQSDEYRFPSSDVYGSEYSGCYNAAVKDLTNFNAGSFKEARGYSSLPYGYEYQKGGSSPMTFTTEGKGLIIVFKANSSGMGSITVNVNGKDTKINGNKLYTWGGPDAELGYYQNISGKLDVSIKADNPSADFTIWGIGVIR